jgi:integral membrane protein
MSQTPIGRLRLIGWIEGASFLLLVCVAMPLKYIWGEPLGVRIVGMAHGLLWLAFVGVLYDTMKQEGWPLSKAAVPFVAALVPFGPFIIDRRLKEAPA